MHVGKASTDHTPLFENALLNYIYKYNNAKKP